MDFIHTIKHPGSLFQHSLQCLRSATQLRFEYYSAVTRHKFQIRQLCKIYRLLSQDINASFARNLHHYKKAGGSYFILLIFYFTVSVLNQTIQTSTNWCCVIQRKLHHTNNRVFCFCLIFFFFLELFNSYLVFFYLFKTDNSPFRHLINNLSCFPYSLDHLKLSKPQYFELLSR